MLFDGVLGCFMVGSEFLFSVVTGALKHSVWVWNLRLELGYQLQPDQIRTTEFAPAIPLAPLAPPLPPHAPLPSGYASPHIGVLWKAGRFSGQDFPLQSDG